MATAVQTCISNIVWVSQATLIATNGYPSGAVGVAPPGSNNRRAIGADVHCRAAMTVSAGTLSMTLSLYGMAEDDSNWYHLRDLNAGNAISVASQANSSSAATNMFWAERVSAVGGGYQRYYLRVNAIGGTNPSIVAAIGFSPL